MSDGSIEKDLQKILQRTLDSMTSDRDYWKNLAIKMAQPCAINKSRDCPHCQAQATVYQYLQQAYKK